MKTLKTLLYTFVALVVFAIAACNNNSSNNNSGRSPTTPPRGTGPNGIFANSTCTNGQSATGRMYDPSASNSGGQTGGSFQQSWANFLSASVDPAILGNLSGDSSQAQNGVDIQLKIKLNASGTGIDPTQSAIRFVIYDSYYGSTQGGQQVPPIDISFSQATQGQVQGNMQSGGTYTVSFQDAYGQVAVMQGQFNSTNSTGTINFQNSQEFDGSATRSGSLGSYYIPTCGIFY